MPTNTSRSYPITPPNLVTVNVASIIFTGPHANYNPLFDREPSAGFPKGSEIEPPQWEKKSGKNEPISYVKRKSATLKLDITGSPDKLRGPVWVKVTPKAELLKKTVTEDGKEELVPDPGTTPITFTRRSEEIRVTNWDDPDYEQLSFTTNPLPDEVRLNQLKITWNFKYGYTKNGPWFDAGKERTAHELYITYRRPYYGFPPFYRPWKQVLKTACSYAHGAKTTIEASSMVTPKIYMSFKFNYISRKSHSEFDNCKIKLWDMLKEDWVDCMDGSNYYTILMRWLGIPAHQKKISPSPSDKFVYKLLRPISRSKNLKAEWGIDRWDFHQVGILSHVYDPIIMIDPERKIIPANMPRWDYERAIFESGQFVWDSLALVTSVH